MYDAELTEMVVSLVTWSEDVDKDMGVWRRGAVGS